ncbi:Hypothetical predicted protein [Paramuricea clavata]|uniref:Uncharacterized protein n=1 Tax=Paramuricea clavata TaxID=317549 RepID=A0A6S7I3Z0_PARCT|nr:Hypothetical predicted protein [Paramuricea clavata]
MSWSLEHWKNTCENLESKVQQLHDEMEQVLQKKGVTPGEEGARGAEIESSEGIAEGDPLAMAMYALAVTPLIRKLRSHEPTLKQVWFADDSSGGGKIISLRRWWQCLLSVSP